MILEDGMYDVSEILECGVYILLRRSVVVYVGQSRSMVRRIYTHMSHVGQKHWLKSQRGFVFDEIWVKPCSIEELDTLERAMITKYQPLYNTHHKTKPRREQMPLENIVASIMTHRHIAAPSAEPRALIDRRGR